jgi:hypothetical protein
MNELLGKKVIIASRSEFSSPAFMVYQKGNPRLVIDFRRMNAHVKAPAYPMPLICRSLTSLGESKLFTGLDLEEALLFHASR